MNVKISAISYLNTFPFLYGIYSDKNFMNKISLSTDYPSLCASKLINNNVDIGLIPIAVLPEIENRQIISDFCIGASGRVQSVMLFSDVPISDIDNLYLDYQSRTSVGLIKILAKNHWKISPKWIAGLNGYEKDISGKKA
ncbi:MAG: MqnA/MqnD/SBP family protein, partial [Bacteroidota bacterium]|nr:MqnA/MqnD/SBP family protein [Bacteroidota bacterium]